MIVKVFKGIVHRGMVIVGALTLALAFFLVLPLLQSLTKSPTDQAIALNVDVVQEPPPEEPDIPEEPPEENEDEEPPPQLTEEAPPLDLSQLELALNPGMGGGWGADFSMQIDTSKIAGRETEALFSLSDLDERPRAIYQPGPTLTSQLRKKAPGKVDVIFIVDERGRVQNATIRNSTDPVFERPALAAVKRWKFEPGRRGGEPVQFRMLAPITFPRGQ